MTDPVDPELAGILSRFDAATTPEGRALASRELGIYSEKKRAAEVGRPVLYAPADVDWASVRWGANCGPAALAAVLECDVGPLKPQFPQFPHRAYTTLTQMKEALGSRGRLFSARQLRRADGVLPAALPTYTLVQVQWTGPWTEPGANPRWAYTHTHWIATVGERRDPRANPLFPADPREWVYDVNADHETISGDPRLSVLRASGGGWIHGTERTPMGVFFALAKDRGRRCFPKTPRGTPVRSYYRVFFFDARKPRQPRERRPRPPKKAVPGSGRAGNFGGRRVPRREPEVITLPPRSRR
ncbi:MAG: hypothetical protein EKK55_24455 [Rhodocyclaceae bacterium]|nr:MAG: hypothetical protein EKK55_24455 [Rhodocyclaceae bacterium]